MDKTTEVKQEEITPRGGKKLLKEKKITYREYYNREYFKKLDQEETKKVFENIHQKIGNVLGKYEEKIKYIPNSDIDNFAKYSTDHATKNVAIEYIYSVFNDTSFGEILDKNKEYINLNSIYSRLCAKIDFCELEPGDLVFLKSKKNKKDIRNVYIYRGNNKCIGIDNYYIEYIDIFYEDGKLNEKILTAGRLTDRKIRLLPYLEENEINKLYNYLLEAFEKGELSEKIIKIYENSIPIKEDEFVIGDIILYRNLEDFSEFSGISIYLNNRWISFYSDRNAQFARSSKNIFTHPELARVAIFNLDN